MSLIVEDGTGLSNAESYASVADADAYHLSMGNTAWTGAEQLKEKALRRATQYLDAWYRFRGERLLLTQSLEFPRVGVTDLLPDWPMKNLVAATCELALRALSGTLISDTEGESIRREKVGPIETEYFRNDGAQVRYTLVDKLLKDLVHGANSSVRVERAS